MIAPVVLINLFKRFSKKENLKRLFYSKLIKKNDLCFDIGANIGSKSKIFLSLGARVIAFEPQRDCFQKLNGIKSNNKNFDFEQIAIGDQNSVEKLYLSNHSETASLSRDFITFYSNKDSIWNGEVEVKQFTLDFIIEKFGLPDYCKIDVEGYEYKILSNLSYNIKLIEFEFTEGCFDDTLKIVKLLKSDRTKFNFILNENPKFKLKDWVSAEELNEILVRLPKKDCTAIYLSDLMLFDLTNIF